MAILLPELPGDRLVNFPGKLKTLLISSSSKHWIKVVILWVMTPGSNVVRVQRFRCLHPQDGGRIVLRNTRILQHH
jgi:hypothetical protein